MRILCRDDIAKLLSMSKAIELMREVFSAVGEGKSVLPERTAIEIANERNVILFMPGYIPAAGAIGQKIVSVFPSNVKKGLPTINAQIVVINPDTGEVSCFMEGGLITGIRTAAVSALATDILAKANTRTLAVFGAGVQGISHIEAMLEVRTLEHIKIFDPNEESAEKLLAHCEYRYSRHINFKIAKTAEEAVSNSDIIVTATTSETPVFNGNYINKGTHINAVGSFKPSVREVDDSTIKKAKLYVDVYDHALKEAGDLIIPLRNGLITENDIRGDLGELILNKIEGRENDEDITFFKSVGMALEDVAVAKWIFDKAEAENLGTVV